MIKINLLSPEKKDISAAPDTVSFTSDEEKVKKLSIPAIITALLITVAVVGVIFYFQDKAIGEKQKNLDSANAALTELKEVIKEVDELTQAKAMLEEKLNIIEGLKSARQKVVKMMDQLSTSLPDLVWLTNLTFNSNAISLSGKALSMSLIGDFINNLKATNYFDNIQYITSSRKNELGFEILDFRLTCVFKQDIIKKVG